MSNLTGQQIKQSYKKLLIIDNAMGFIGDDDSTTRIITGDGANSTNIYLSTNRVGVGTATPESTFHIYYNEATAFPGIVNNVLGKGGLKIENENINGVAHIQFRSGDADGYILYDYHAAGNNGNMHFFTDGQDGRPVLTLMNDGTVGINCDTAAANWPNSYYQVDVKSKDDTHSMVRIYAGSTNIPRLSLENSSKHYSTSIQDSKWLFYDETDARGVACFDSNGKFGLGDYNTPEAYLDVRDSTLPFQVATSDYNGTDTGSRFRISFGAASGNTSTYLQCTDAGGTSASNLFLQKDSGKVAIGSTFAEGYLHVQGETIPLVLSNDDYNSVDTGTRKKFHFSGSTGNVHGRINVADTGGTNDDASLYIQNDGGNTLIGSDTQSTVHIRGQEALYFTKHTNSTPTSTIAYFIQEDNTQNAYIGIKSNNAVGAGAGHPGIYFSHDATTTGYILNTDDSLRFYAGGGTPSSHVGITQKLQDVVLGSEAIPSGEVSVEIMGGSKILGGIAVGKSAPTIVTLSSGHAAITKNEGGNITLAAESGTADTRGQITMNYGSGQVGPRTGSILHIVPDTGDTITVTTIDGGAVDQAGAIIGSIPNIAGGASVPVFTYVLSSTKHVLRMVAEQGRWVVTGGHFASCTIS